MPIADRANAINQLYHILCNLTIMVNAGYITQEEADTLRPQVLAALREALGL